MSRSRALVLFLVMVVAALTIARAHLSEPRIAPDSRLYLRLADNLRLNGCFSESEPDSRACMPSWGSQPPAYALFLVGVRSIGSDPRLITTIQAVIFTAAALWLAASFPYAGIPQLVGRVVLVLASPLTLAWGRWVLTETLAMATTLCVFAVFLRALHTRRVNVPMLAAVLIAAITLRWDQVWLLLPAVVLLWMLSPWRVACRRAVLLMCVVGLPYMALSARALVVGLPPLPTQSVEADMPPGILRFWRTAALDQRLTGQLLWPSWSREYSRVRDLDMSSMSANVPRTAVVPLLARLATTQPGADFPSDLDAQFGHLAQQLATDHPAHVHVAVPLVRLARLWRDRDGLFLSGWEGLGYGEDRTEVWRTTYRLLLVVMVVLALLTGGRRLRPLTILLLVYFCARSWFLASMGLLETRYLVELFPLMEFVAVWWLAGAVKTAIMLVNRERTIESFAS